MSFANYVMIAASLLISNVLVADCPTSNITFTTQAQVDSFRINYPNCTTLEHAFFLQGADITNMDSLISLERIEDAFSISATGITDMSGLDNVTFITEAFIFNNNSMTSLAGWENIERFDLLWLQGNTVLVSLDHLTSLTGITRRLILSTMPSLTDLRGLEGVTCIGAGASTDRFQINDLENLTSLDGLDNLQEIQGNLQITLNEKLADFSGLASLRTIEGIVTVRGNTSLASMDGLSSLDICGEISLEENPLINDLEGLENVTSIGRLTITNSMAFISLQGLGPAVVIDDISFRNIGFANLQGLENITQIQNLEILNNSALTDLTGLSNLSTVSTFTITNNDNLGSLAGIPNLTMIQDEMVISGNAKLTSIFDLGLLTIVPSTGISIVDNPMLSLCATSGICALINLDSSLVTTHNNAPLCMSTADILTVCGCPTANAYYPDMDGDGFGDSDAAAVAFCPDQVPSNQVMNNIDCSDTNPEDDILIISDTLATSQEHRGITELISSNVLESGHTFLFQAGNSVTLIGAFEVNMGTVLEVQIDSCGTVGQ